MNEKEVLIEVGKLAGLVSGQLNAVDRSTLDYNSHGGLANKININNFINSIKNNTLPSANQPTNTPLGFTPAYPDETLVQSMEPDVSKFSIRIGNPGSPMPPQDIEAFITQQPLQEPRQEIVQKQILLNKEINTSELVEDIKSIKATLININSTFTKISGMMGKVFNYITEKERKTSKQ